MTVVTLFEGFLFVATATVIAGLSYLMGRRDGSRHIKRNKERRNKK